MRGKDDSKLVAKNMAVVILLLHLTETLLTALLFTSSWELHACSIWCGCGFAVHAVTCAVWTLHTARHHATTGMKSLFQSKENNRFSQVQSPNNGITCFTIIVGRLRIFQIDVCITVCTVYECKASLADSSLLVSLCLSGVCAVL